MRILLADAAKCFDLIEECAELWDDPDAWQGHLTGGVERLIGGCGGTFAVSRAVAGTPIRVEVIESYISGSDKGLRQLFTRYVREGAFALLPETEIITPAVLANGKRVYQQSDLVTRDELHGSALYRRYFKKHRLEHTLSAIQSTPEGLVVGLALQRKSGERRFSRRDRSVLDLLLTLLAPRLGLRLTMRCQGGRHVLSPRMRQTLDALLDGASEKQVAGRLGISQSTAHEYVLGLYRHFGVKSRSQLLAHYARRRPSRGDPEGSGRYGVRRRRAS